MARLMALAPAAMLLMAQAAAPAAPENPPPKPPAQKELIYSGEASSILGRMVVGPNANDIGRIVDVLVDEAGQPRAAVIDVGGFMGMGTRRIAVAWRALQFTPSDKGGTVTIDMSIDQIKDTPEFKRQAGPSAPPITVAAPPEKAPEKANAIK